MARHSYLADSNILLRLSKRDDPLYGVIRAAILSLRDQRLPVCYNTQGLAEFWNVSTRPREKNGFGLSIQETDDHARQIEAEFSFLPEHAAVHKEWRRLIVVHAVKGVQVHDARLVASMHVHGVSHLLTLNGQDFVRYPGITVVHPREWSAVR